MKRNEPSEPTPPERQAVAMNRRTFLATLAAASLAYRHAASQQSARSTLTLGPASKSPIPIDFVGLSYESAQLANPAFFSAADKPLIALFRQLSPHGNLRLGGGSSEFTTFSETAAPSIPFEVFGPDTSKTVKLGTTTSKLALQNLRAFLDHTNWNCLYGLNLGQGSIENAVTEAEAVHTALGPRLLAFQIGNEPDSFRNRYRPAAYTPSDFMVEWTKFHDAIAARVPGARFAGPDISNKLAYLTAFAEQAPLHPDVILLTSHYYAMGPAGSKNATIDNLLSSDPKSSTLKDRDLHVIAEAEQLAHLPYRMSEGNSCWNGGEPGVSDTFASALWCADYMLTCMSRGWAGVNLHGGGNGYYTPIAGSPSAGFVRRPEFFGMLLAARYAGAHMVAVDVDQPAARVGTFVFERNGQREIVLINKSPDAHICMLPPGTLAHPTLRLGAPAIDAKDGVALERVKAKAATLLSAPPYTATVYQLQTA